MNKAITGRSRAKSFENLMKMMYRNQGLILPRVHHDAIALAAASLSLCVKGAIVKDDDLPDRSVRSSYGLFEESVAE